MPNTSDAIPLRQFGRHKVKISAVGFGGHHLGDAPDEKAAVRMVPSADYGCAVWTRLRRPSMAGTHP
jgi:hypothetical protein